MPSRMTLALRARVALVCLRANAQPLCIDNVYTERYLERMPNELKPKAIRVPDDLWEKAKIRAAERGETVSHAVRMFLIEYINKGKS